MDVAVLYINGLGDGQFGYRERFLTDHWEKAGAQFVCAGVNWYDSQSLEAKIRQVEARLRSLLKVHRKVILLGSSAGASLAMHAFMKHRKENVYVVVAHGRLQDGHVRWPDYRTLEWAAHLTPNNPNPKSQAFYDSVTRCEQDVLPALKADDLRRILILKPLLDFVVPLKTMGVPGAPTRRSFAVGHKLAGLTDLVFLRNKIIRFATMETL